MIRLVDSLKLRRARLAALALGLLAVLSATPVAAKVRVQLEGLSGAERDNVESRLSLKLRAEADDAKLEAPQIRRLHQQASADIREALQPFGYYSPEIEASLEQDGDDWRARYVVKLGPPTQVVQINAAFAADGAEFEPLTRRLRWMPLKLDQRLMHADYEASKKRMSDAALAHGFLDAQWLKSELRVEPEIQQARVTLWLDTGPRYFFGPLSIEQEALDPTVMARYAQLPEGDPFDPQALLDLQFRLSDLGYFQSVEIDPQRDQTDEQRRIPIHIRTTLRARTKYDFGIGYGTDTGARLSVGTDWRRLNRYGHTLNTDFRLSEIKNTLGAVYRIPLGEKVADNLSLSSTVETEKLDAGDTEKYVIGASLNRSPGDWQRRLYVDFTHEESEFGDEVTTADLLTPGLSFTRTEADDPIFTRRGWYVFADVHGAVNNVLSSTSFLQTRVLGRAVYPLHRRLRLLGRAEFGYSIIEEFGELPASQRFFAGGDQSVRGYRYQSIGPRNEDGDVIGGRYLSVFSVEAEYRVLNNWGAAIFMDSGGADDDPGPDLSTGIGAGIRYRAPIGSLQLDLAHPLAEEESGVRLHIGIRVGV
ncbi:MAG: autotransporter assembly complex protein TamA [Panacagrimonas sp.]